MDPQVALILLRLCGSYCKFIHLARVNLPSLVSEALQLFDVEVRQCFTQSIAVEVRDRAWQQAQLNLSHRAWAYAAFRTGGGRIFLIGDLNYDNIYLSVISILYIDALYDVIQDNKYPLALKSKFHN